jgi:hypothetical protein
MRALIDMLPRLFQIEHLLYLYAPTHMALACLDLALPGVLAG